MRVRGLLGLLLLLLLLLALLMDLMDVMMIKVEVFSYATEVFIRWSKLLLLLLARLDDHLQRFLRVR